MADRTVLFEAGQAGPPFLQSIGVTCEFKVDSYMVLFVSLQRIFDVCELWILSIQIVCILQAYPDLGHSLSKEELLYLESWIKSRLNASAEKDS